MRDASVGIRRGEVVALLGAKRGGKIDISHGRGANQPAYLGPDSHRRRAGPGRSDSLGQLAEFSAEAHRLCFPEIESDPFPVGTRKCPDRDGTERLQPASARRRALELLDELGVADRAENSPSMLSGGEQQRVAIARALANDPSVILADEPTAALDSHRGRQVMELFRGVAHEHGAGVIVVTHDHRTLEVFDTIYEMEDGAITKSGNSQETSSAVTPLSELDEGLAIWQWLHTGEAFAMALAGR